MSKPSQTAKDKAFQNQNTVQSMAAAAGGGAGISALIPGVGIFIAAGVGAVAAAASFYAIKLGKLVHDPPRDDYSTTTTIAESTIDTDGLGGVVIERAALDLVRELDGASRALDAMVVAAERSAGAELAGDLEMVQARDAEVFEFAQRAASNIRAAGELTRPFQDALEEIRPEVLDLMDAAGISRTYLRRLDSEFADDPIAAIIAASDAMAISNFEFAEFLEASANDRTLIEPY